MNENHRFLREFVEGSESAFQELVRRYIDLVYSTALRRVGGDSHRAQDVAQTVFIDLARKAASLPPDVMLGGWLHRHCCFVASNVLRAESRRVAREQEAALMNATGTGESTLDWERLSPVIDETIQELPVPDRDALLLRFFEKHDYRAIGAALGSSDDAAQKRTSRALEKLRQLLSARGIALSLAALDGLLAANAVQAAPAGWAGDIGRSALEHAPAKAGWLAGVAALLFTNAGKIAAIALILGTLLWQANRWRASSPDESAVAKTTSSTRQLSAAEAFVSTKSNSLSESDITGPALSNVLRLAIVSAETLEPLSGIAVEWRAFTEHGREKRDLASAANGICLAPIPTNDLIDLQLKTSAEGYASMRLLWHVNRGQKVPERYTLKLAPATVISGTVVDADGAPVEGAEVGFNHDDDPALALQIESPIFDWITAQTDSSGRWKIASLADEMIRKLRGAASHPEHVGSSYLQASEDPSGEAALRQGTHIFKLGAAVTVRGFVRETGGTPIAQANVLVGPQGMSGSRKAVTELDGSFEARGVKPGPTLVSAEAPQYAPTTVSWVASTNGEPVELVLARGKILKLRVVDRLGQPVTNAHVGLNTISRWPRRPGEPFPPASQATFRANTDLHGRVMWNQAPDEELTFNMSAVGFMQASEIKVRPDGNEHTVILQPALRVRGTVLDAETGAEIPSFKLVAGWPDLGPGGRIVPTWSPMDRFWLSFGAGKFDHVFSETVLGGTPDPEFIFKIEAEGYAPFISRVVKADEGEVTFDVRLEKSASVEIQVLNPDGRPAANTDVAFANATEQINLTGSGFAPFGHGAKLTTDTSGKVRWQPDPNVVEVYCANSLGFAQKTPAQLQADPTLQLQSWGRAEVTILKRDKPVVGRKVFAVVPNRDQSMPWLHISQPQPTDAQGKAILEKLPPGKFDLAYLSRNASIGESYTHVNFDSVTIQPNETATVVHRIEGLDVRVRVVWPEGFARDKAGMVHAMLHTAAPVPPTEIQGDPAKVQQWMQLPENQEAFKKARQFPLAHKEGDVWESTDVPPGDYSLFFFSGGPSRPGEPQPPSIQGNLTVTVPSDYAEEVLNAGELNLQLLQP